MYHDYDGLNRVHRFAISAEEIELCGHRVKADSCPPEILQRMGRMAADAQFKFRNEGDAKRLKYFKRKFGPWFSYEHLPRGKFDAKA